MANIPKSFNFRNGLQVDNDNFVVNANGNVGIGTSIPQAPFFLDVYGDTRVSGLITSSTLRSGIGTITNFTATNATVGILTATTLQIGSNSVTNLIGFGFTAWITDNAGVGLHRTSKIGINTTTSPGASDSELTVNGNANITGIVTANSFSGDLTGNVNAASGVSTFTQLKVGTAITMSAGTISATTFSGSLPTSNLTGTISSTQIANSAVTDAKIDTVSASKLTGALPAISGAAVTSVTAVGLTGSPNVNLGITTSSSIISGSIVGTGLSVTSIGIGTASPANTFQQRATGTTELQITSDTASASITVGREPGTANTNNAEFRYGGGGGFAFSNAQSLDIVNYGTGNFNYYLSANNAGAAAGDYVWHKGANNDQLMSLTKDGNLGIGITNPSQKLSVQGISTFTGNAHFDSDVTIDGSIIISALTATLTGDVQDGSSDIILDVSQKLLNGNVNTASGISTFNNSKFNKIGISADPDTSHVLTACSSASNRFHVTGDGKVGIKTTSINTNIELDVNGDVQARHGLVVGLTTTPKCTIDMSSAVDIVADGASRATVAYMIPPKVTTTQRNALRDTGGNALSADEAGAMIYNITTNKLQVWNGSTWNDCF